MTDGAAARPGTAAELLRRAEQDWPRFLSGAHHVGLRHFDERTQAGWRYRDLIAHAAAWHRICAADVAVLRRGEQPVDRSDADAVNAEVARTAGERSPHDLLAELGASWEDLREVLASVTDEDLSRHDGRIVAKVAGNTWEHYEEHLGELRAARPATAETFVARLDGEWSLMRDAVAALGPEGLERPTGTGWRYRDLLAHASGWLEDSSARLPAVLADPQVVFEAVDIDGSNARSLERRAGMSAGGLVVEHEALFDAMRSAVLALTDEQLGDRRVSGFLAARTYLHLDEHLSELEAAARS